jgi:hypothetical protein
MFYAMLAFVFSIRCSRTILTMTFAVSILTTRTFNRSKFYDVTGITHNSIIAPNAVNTARSTLVQTATKLLVSTRRSDERCVRLKSNRLTHRIQYVITPVFMRGLPAKRRVRASSV